MRNLLLVATRHNEGKTVLALGLAAALEQRGLNVGYMKAVGHGNAEAGEARVDSDAHFMRQTCGLQAAVTDLSPVVLDGFPQDWVTADGRERAVEKIRSALSRAASKRDCVIIEATGNASTGACFGFSNGRLAKELNAQVLLIASGGVGQPTDEVILNAAYLERVGGPALGVLVNKAYPHELARLDSFMKPIVETMNLRFLGAVPYDQELARPMMANLLEHFRAKVLNGKDRMNAKVGRYLLGATTVPALLEQLQGNVTLLCPSDREDLVLAAVAALMANPKAFRLNGIVFAGRAGPAESVLQVLRRTTVPAIHVELDAYSMASLIHTTAYKLSANDVDGVKKARELVAKHVDIAAIVNGVKA